MSIKTQQDLEQFHLLVIAMLSLIAGILFFELVYLIASPPAWTALLAYFAVGVNYKLIMATNKAPQQQPRFVTIEFDIKPLRRQEVMSYG